MKTWRIHLWTTTPFSKYWQKPLLIGGIGLIVQLTVMSFQVTGNKLLFWKREKGTAVWNMTSHQPKWHGWSQGWLSWREHEKILPFLENPWRFSFKNTPFLLVSMDLASNRKTPSFSMQMHTSVCSTFGPDCRGQDPNSLRSEIWRTNKIRALRTTIHCMPSKVQRRALNQN